MDHDGLFTEPAHNMKYLIAVLGIKKLDNHYCILALLVHSVVFLGGLGQVYVLAGFDLKTIELNGTPLIIHPLYIHSFTPNWN